MTRTALAAALVVVVLSASAAAAQEAEDHSVPCLGPLCALTPVLRIGRALLPEDRTLAPASGAASASPTAQPQATSTPTSADGSSALPAARQSGGPQPQPVTDGAAAPVATVATQDDDASATPTRPLRQRRHATRHVARPAIRSVAATAGEVTIAANRVEMSRLLALASVVRSPRVRVVPALAPFEGCTRRPADFVVDTMSDPDRLGPAIPLFTESLIIVARDGVHDIRDLNGKTVSFGLPGGSSERVARRVFAALKVAPQEVPLDVGNALDGLALGDLDAVALLVPAGSDILAHRDAHLHLLPLPDGLVPPDGLKLSRIEPAVYLGRAWTQTAMSVVTVDAVLSPRQPSRMPPVAQALYAALDRRSPQLAENGFDLIGGGGLITMRSVAKDNDRHARAVPDSGC